MANYYVNYNTGNDSWDGSSPIYVSGNIGPKKNIPGSYADTVATGGRLVPVAGDVIYLARGVIWPEYSKVNVSNIVGPVTYTSYGDQNLSQPMIELWKSIKTTDWTHLGNGLWITGVIAGFTWTCTRLFFNKIGQQLATSIGAVGVNSPWFFDQDPANTGNYGTLYVWNGDVINNPTITYKSVHAYPYYWNGQTQANQAFTCVNCTNITINDIHMRGGLYTVDIQSQNATVAKTENIKVTNCTFDYCNVGINTAGTSVQVGTTDVRNCIISNNTFYGNPGPTENVVASKNHFGHIRINRNTNGVTIEGNTFIDPVYYGILLTTILDYTPTQNITIINNYFSNRIINTRPSKGITINNAANIVKNIVIEQNYLENIGSAIELGGEDITARNNIINGTIDNSHYKSGIRTGSGSGNRVKNISVYNNTILNCSLYSIVILDNAGYPIDNVLYYNNIIHNVSTNCTLYIKLTHDADMKIYNNIMNSNVTKDVIIYDSVAMSLNTAETIYAGDIFNNIQVDPELTDFLGPSNISPALGAGVKTPERDFTGAFRSALQYDIGARSYNIHSDTTN